MNEKALLAELLFSPVVKDKMEHIAASTEEAPLGLIIECGVFKGASLSVIADAVYPRTVFGLDSFEGLPDPWVRSPEQTVGKGHFRLGMPIEPPRENAKIVAGKIEETLPILLKEYPGEQIAFLHVDIDLGSVTAEILKTCTDRCRTGTIIRFDEFCDWGGYGTRYPEWPKEEYKAFSEWLEASGKRARAVSRDSWEGATFSIL